MPTINRKPCTTRPKLNVRSHFASGEKDDKRKQVYSSNAWHSLRKGYLLDHPLDEVALIAGKYVFADCVHHMYSFVEATTPDQMTALAFNTNNLCALSNKTHNLYHAIMEARKEPVVGHTPKQIYNVIYEYCDKHNRRCPWE